jgi:hypothetical protein
MGMMAKHPVVARAALNSFVPTAQGSKPGGIAMRYGGILPEPC